MKYIQFFKSAKVILWIAGICFSLSSVSGQSVNTEYFMSSSFTKTSLNPAKRPEKGYIGIPGLTNLYVDYKTNTFKAENFLYPGLGENGKTATFLHNNVTADMFLGNIAPNNYANIDFDYTPIGFGFYTGDLFLNFDISLRANSNVNMPYSFFELAKKGVPKNGDKLYDLSNVSVNANVFGQIGAGGSYPLLNKSLMVGAKIKFLLGLAHARVNFDKMSLHLEKDRWYLAESQASIQTIGFPPKYDEEGVFDWKMGDISPKVSGFGLGFDLGATFQPGKYFDFVGDLSYLDNFTASFALTDIGFISWSKNKTNLLSNSGKMVPITGDHVFGFEDNEGNSLGDIIDNLGDNFKEAIKFREDPNGEFKGSSGLQAKMNWGLEYAFLEGKLNTGLLTSTHFNPAKTFTEVTLAGAYRPANGFEMGLSYSFAHSHFQTFGLALHFGPGFYIASDYIIPHINSIFMPTTTTAWNFQVGCAIPIGAKH